MQPVIDPNIFVYLTLFALAFLALSFLIGGHHASHHHGGGHGTHHGGHGHHHHHHGATHHAEDGRFEKAGHVSPFSLQTILLFIAGIGVGGYFADILLLRSIVVIGVALVGGFAMGGIGYSFLNYLYQKQGSSDTVATRDAVGQTGTVLVGIPQGGRGKISCRIGGRSETFSARSVGPAIPLNSVVVITGTVGSTVIVEPTDPQDFNNDVPAWRRLS